MPAAAGPHDVQIAWHHDGASFERLELPGPETQVLPGIRWGHTSEFFTPAFWKYHAHAHRRSGRFDHHALGRTLVEEVCACLLAGHGVRAELALAVFARVRDEGLLRADAPVDALERALRRPLGGAGPRYRFARRKASQLPGAVRAARRLAPPHAPLELRRQLLAIDGIGPKTASWIVRNHLGSNDVAILDVHITRACVAAGVFPRGSDPARDYFGLEHRFLAFCAAIGEPASRVDAIMWGYMRRLSHLAARGDTRGHEGGGTG